jgi:hypothetical protein
VGHVEQPVRPRPADTELRFAVRRPRRLRQSNPHTHLGVLVLLGVRVYGTKEQLIAPAEGLRESTESWADLLRDCRRRGMRDPELVIGDGGSPPAALAMVFKLVESAQTRWRAITGAQLVPPVQAGARFENGVLVERSEVAA